MVAVKAATRAVPIADMIAVIIHDFCGWLGVEITGPSATIDFGTKPADTSRRDRSSRFLTPTLFAIGHLI